MSAEEYKKCLSALLCAQIKNDASLEPLFSILNQTSEIKTSRADKYTTVVSPTNKGESAYQRAIIAAEKSLLNDVTVAWLDIELPVTFAPPRRIDLLGRADKKLVLCELKYDGAQINPRSKGRPDTGSPLYALFELLIYYYHILRNSNELQEKALPHTNRKGNWTWPECENQKNVFLIIAGNINYWERWKTYHGWRTLLTQTNFVKNSLPLAIRFFSTPEPNPSFSEQSKKAGGIPFPPLPLIGAWTEITE